MTSRENAIVHGLACMALMTTGTLANNNTLMALNKIRRVFDVMLFFYA
jgi:hypothetical protein